MGILASLVMLLMFATSASAKQSGWEALKNGTAFVVMRHALAPGTGDPANFRIGDCSTQRNLSDVGRQQARETGELFKAKGIEVVVYEPVLKEKEFFNSLVMDDLNEFKESHSLSLSEA